MVFTKHITDSRILCFCVISHQLCYYRMSIKKTTENSDTWVWAGKNDPKQGSGERIKYKWKIKASQNGQLYSGLQRVHPTNPDKFGFRFCSWHLLFSNKKRWNLSETCVCNEPPHGYMFIYYTGDTVNTMKTHMFNLTEMFIHVSWENRLYLYQTCKPTALESF